ncbi:MAG: hypothetical protein S4CHLAM6_13930 [Chlamydiae bacterium]|nr:hypothetical protein [Chlamydiota bacterium]
MKTCYKLFFIFTIISMSLCLLSANSFEVDLSPEEDLIDAPIYLIINGLDPNEEINVEVDCKDSDNVSWASNTRFRADHLGRVDLSKTAPIKGRYNSVDSTGIIWSMLPNEKQTQCYYIQNEYIDFSLKIFRSSQLAFKRNIRRYLRAENVQMVKIQDKATGEFYYPDSDMKKTGVIVLGGSNGGISRQKAQLLASHGHPALALGYFRAEGLPDTLEEMPLEYVVDAVKWLRKYADCNKVALLGTSRGAELALLVGSYFPNVVDAIIANVPSSVAHNAIPNNEVSAWSYNGTPVPFIKGLKDEVIQDLISSKKLLFHEGSYEDPYEISEIFLAQKQTHHLEFIKAQIPVENITAPLLLLSADDDKMWPSKFYCLQILDQLKKKSSKIKVIYRSYDKAGHGISFPHYPSENLPYYHPVTQKWFTLGGTMEGNARANQDSWNCILNFLQEG